MKNLAIGDMAVSRSLLRRTQSVSRNKVPPLSPFTPLQVEKIFPDSDNPRIFLVNFKQVLGAYELRHFKKAGAITLCLCRPVMTLRRLREKLWSEIERLRRMAMQ